ncbi:MAG: hypothetical protein H0W06_06055 [Chloroflexia bacterium]|nr:hypothetical protein [Chloroflexia bacterium]
MTYRTTPPSVLAWLACYVVWVVLSALGLWLFLKLRINAVDIARRLSGNAYAVSTADRVGTVVLGLTWLVGVVVLESVLRTAVTRHRLQSRAARIAIVMVAMLIVSYALQWLL